MSCKKLTSPLSAVTTFVLQEQLAVSNFVENMIQTTKIATLSYEKRAAFFSSCFGN